MTEIFDNKHKLEKIMMQICFLKEVNMEIMNFPRSDERFGVTLFQLRSIIARELMIFDDVKISTALKNIDTQKWLKQVNTIFIPSESAWKIYDASNSRKRLDGARK